jgi:hypothetical protein
MALLGLPDAVALCPITAFIALSPGEMSDEKCQEGMSRRAVLVATAAGMASSQAWAAAPASGPEAYLSLREVARRIAAREVSPVDLTQRMLARIAKADPGLKPLCP